MGKMHSPDNPPSSEQRSKWGQMAAGIPHKKLPCPKCGDDYANIGNHIPACEGGDD